MNAETRKYLFSTLLLMLLSILAFIGGAVFFGNNIVEDKESPVLGIGS